MGARAAHTGLLEVSAAPPGPPSHGEPSPAACAQPSRPAQRPHPVTRGGRNSALGSREPRGSSGRREFPRRSALRSWPAGRSPTPPGYPPTPEGRVLVAAPGRRDPPYPPPGPGASPALSEGRGEERGTQGASLGPRPASASSWRRVPRRSASATQLLRPPGALLRVAPSTGDRAASDVHTHFLWGGWLPEKADRDPECQQPGRGSQGSRVAAGTEVRGVGFPGTLPTRFPPQTSAVARRRESLQRLHRPGGLRTSGYLLLHRRVGGGAR